MIYTVTTIKTIYPYKNPVHTYYLGRRCVGWFHSLADAQGAVERNDCDIYEEGYYPFAVIEETSEGLYNVVGNNEYWYQWIEDGYKRIMKPKSLSHTCGFGIG